jgi:hypothetical protein
MAYGTRKTGRSFAEVLVALADRWCDWLALTDRSARPVVREPMFSPHKAQARSYLKRLREAGYLHGENNNLTERAYLEVHALPPVFEEKLLAAVDRDDAPDRVDWSSLMTCHKKYALEHAGDFVFFFGHDRVFGRPAEWHEVTPGPAAAGSFRAALAAVNGVFDPSADGRLVVTTRKVLDAFAATRSAREEAALLLRNAGWLFWKFGVLAEPEAELVKGSDGSRPLFGSLHGIAVDGDPATWGEQLAAAYKRKQELRDRIDDEMKVIDKILVATCGRWDVFAERARAELKAGLAERAAKEKGEEAACAPKTA